MKILNTSLINTINWFDFSDEKFLIFFIILCICGLGLILILTFFGISNLQTKIYKKKIREQSSSTRVYVIDVKKNSVTFFNRSEIRYKRVNDMNQFYNHFHSNDIDKLKQWIFSICVNYKKAEPYLEIDVMLNRGKVSCFSLLKLLKYDPNVGVIHLESIILKYITPQNLINKKRKGPVSGVIKRSQMENIVNNYKSLRGFVFAIKFIYIRQQVLSNDKIERYMIMTLKNEVYPLCSNNKSPRQIIDDGGPELLLFDMRIDNVDNAMQLATTLKHNLNKSIGVNGFENSITFAIGVVEIGSHYQQFDVVVEKAKETCMSAQQKGEEVLLYHKQVNQMLEIDRYNDEVEKILKPKALRYLFRPIVDVSSKTILGYFQYVRAYDSLFSTFSEMNKFAYRLNKSRQLFALVAKETIARFASEKPNETIRLFMQISMLNIDDAIEILPQFPETKKIHLVLMFDEQEITENSSSLELLNASLKSLRGQNYELAMLMKDRNLLLDNSVYVNFDYFVAGATMVGEIRKNNRIRLSIHTLIEQLLKFKRPIIATDLESWQSIELIIKSGITNVSSDVFAASNDNLIGVDKKKMEKLVSINE